MTDCFLKACLASQGLKSRPVIVELQFMKFRIDAIPAVLVSDSWVGWERESHLARVFSFALVFDRFGRLWWLGFLGNGLFRRGDARSFAFKGGALLFLGDICLSPFLLWGEEAGTVSGSGGGAPRESWRSLAASWSYSPLFAFSLARRSAAILFRASWSNFFSDALRITFFPERWNHGDVKN